MIEPIQKETQVEFKVNEKQFGTLLTVLSTKFINLSTEKIDNEINESLKQICEYIDIDFAALWQLNKNDPEDVYLTNYYDGDIVKNVPIFIEAKKSFPWTLREILKKKIVKYKNAYELPPEAAVDRQTRLHYNLKSLLSFPLYTGKNPVFGVLSFSTAKREIDWTDELIEKFQHIANIYSNALSRKITEKKLKENLEFEKLISSLSARFVNISGDNVDKEINDSLKQICEFLGLDVSSLWLVSKEPPDEILLTHYYSKYKGPDVPGKFLAADTFPWTLKRILEKKIVKCKNISEYPPEAATDKETNKYFGLKSDITIPLFIGENSVFGAISFDTMNNEICWEDEVVNKLIFISQIFANVLSRRLAEKKLHESEERLRLAASSAGAGFWTLDVESGKVWSTEEADILYDVKGRKDTGHIKKQ